MHSHPPGLPNMTPPAPTSVPVNTSSNSNSAGHLSSLHSSSSVMPTPFPGNTLRSWLQKAAATYAHPDKVIADIELILKSYSTLYPKLDVYTHFDGISSRLLHFYGTLPIQFNQSSYQIPIELWFPQTYPVSSPYVYIRPTSNMVIQTSTHVDSNGKVMHSGLLYWDHNSSSLLTLLQQLQHQFSQNPPVYSKPPLASPLSLLQESAPSSLPPPMKPTPSLHLKYNFQSILKECDALFQSYSANITQSMDALLHENKRLHAIQAHVRQLDDIANKELQALESNHAYLEPLLQQYETLIESHEKQEQCDVDQIWQCTTPLMAQWRELMAEDLAIEDTLYHMSKLHSQEKMETSIYLKNIRNLAKEQFILRALAQKCTDILEKSH